MKYQSNTNEWYDKQPDSKENTTKHTHIHKLFNFLKINGTKKTTIIEITEMYKKNLLNHWVI